MKDSGVEWIGDVPEGWEIIRIKYVTQQRNQKGTFNPSCDVYIGLENIIGLSNVLIETESQYEETEYCICKKDDVLYSRLRPNLAKTIICPFDAFCTGELMIFSEFRGEKRFFRYWLLGQGFRDNVVRSTYGSKMPRANPTYIVNLPMCFPPTSEQQEIADYLDTKCAEIDKVEEKTRESIEEYKKLKQAVITEAVTKGVRGPRPMKPSGVEWIGDIPEEWEIFSLRYIGSCQNGISKGGEYFGQGYPFISYSDVCKNITLPTSPTGLVETTTEEQERYSVQCGDIFFTRTSEIGITSVCCASISRATFAGFLIRVRPYNEQILPHYSKYYFRSEIHRRFFVKEMNIVTRASLSQDLLKRMPVLLPDRNEQQEIADYLDAKCGEIDRLISKKEQLITELETYKKSLIYEYVTGKKEVPA